MRNRGCLEHSGRRNAGNGDGEPDLEQRRIGELYGGASASSGYARRLTPRLAQAGIGARDGRAGARLLD